MPNIRTNVKVAFIVNTFCVSRDLGKTVKIWRRRTDKWHNNGSPS